MLLPEKTFPAVFRGEGRKEHEAPDRLSRRMSACGSAAAARAGCGGDRRRTDARRGLDAFTQRHAGAKSCISAPRSRCVPARAGRYAACFPPASSFSRSRRSAPTEESVNASYYTLVTGARSKESAFALHLAARFSVRESVCLTVEWTARLDDGCVTGAEGNRAYSHRGERERPDRSERQRGGFRLRLFRFPRCALCRCARGGSSAAVRLLPALL